MLNLSNKLISINKTNGGQYFIRIKLNKLSLKYFSQNKNENDYAKCYKLLEIPDNSDQELVRKAFINLCKKYHPDSGKASANAQKFLEIESAYRSLQNKFANERWNTNEGIGEYGLYYKEKKCDSSIKPEVFDINHTAPQHRQYLSFEGIGSGTPSQRQKQYIKYKTAVAIENVYSHHIKMVCHNSKNEQSLIIKDKKEAKKIKTRYGMERLVEDLIQESMAKGHFDNLKNQGKPLPSSNYNPYVDFVTHKMNEILLDNGFTPEWILLQKEISQEIELVKEKLSNERKKLGPLPFNTIEKQKWQELIEKLKLNVDKLNKKINKFNLVVPMLEKQKVYFNLEKVSCDILKTGLCSKEHLVRHDEEVIMKKQPEEVLNAFFAFFK